MFAIANVEFRFEPRHSPRWRHFIDTGAMNENMLNTLVAIELDIASQHIMARYAWNTYFHQAFFPLMCATNNAAGYLTRTRILFFDTETFHRPALQFDVLCDARWTIQDILTLTRTFHDHLHGFVPLECHVRETLLEAMRESCTYDGVYALRPIRNTSIIMATIRATALAAAARRTGMLR